MGRLIISMGLVCREISILAHRATAPSKELLLTTAPVLIIHYMCCKYAFCAIHIFLLCSLKINCVMKIQNMCLFLGP
jgi:hypothetical protein